MGGQGKGRSTTTAPGRCIFGETNTVKTIQLTTAQPGSLTHDFSNPPRQERMRTFFPVTKHNGVGQLTRNHRCYILLYNTKRTRRHTRSCSTWIAAVCNPWTPVPTKSRCMQTKSRSPHVNGSPSNFASSNQTCEPISSSTAEKFGSPGQSHARSDTHLVNLQRSIPTVVKLTPLYEVSRPKNWRNPNSP